MSLNTHSKFYYGFEVTADAQFLDFNEGSGELSAELSIGAYSMDEFATEVARALNDAGGNTYTVTVNRTSRVFTITSSSGVSLLVSSGSHNGTSAYGLIGFTGSDRTSATSHVGNASAGTEYATQFILQSYVAPGDQEGVAYGTVNKSASGQIEMVSYGSEQIVEFNLTFVNDYDNGVTQIVRTNLNGVSDLRELMRFLTGKKPFEFMPDENNPNNFYRLILESTPDDSKGLKFKLKELYSKNLPGYFETGVLKCRVQE